MSYENERADVLQRIDSQNPDVRALRYFINVADQWHAIFDQDVVAEAGGDAPTRCVVILGFGVPEQLVHACGVVPIHVLGGSHASCTWSDDVMPRDSDSVSRSILGYALKLTARADLEPLFVVPIANDNLCKIAYFLKREGRAVLPYDIPSVGEGIPEWRGCEHAAQTLLQALCRHMGGRVTTRNMRRADRLVGAARAAAVDFERACIECDGVLTSEARLFVLNSYYQTFDLAEWTYMLRRLTAEVEERHRTEGQSSDEGPRILVIGSPILFPQYKVPSLIQDAGLRILVTVDAASTLRFASLAEHERRGGVKRLTNAIVRKHNTLDATGAHVVNQAMEQYVEYLLANMDIDGVVCHILKGHIGHDFMLARLEPLFERYGVPVFRLETDYQYQDVEQLRIRLEAFAEMLQQRALVSSQANVRLRCA